MYCGIARKVAALFLFLALSVSVLQQDSFGGEFRGSSRRQVY
jgi:hypothetical protein